MIFSKSAISQAKMISQDGCLAPVANLDGCPGTVGTRSNDAPEMYVFFNKPSYVQFMNPFM